MKRPAKLQYGKKLLIGRKLYGDDSSSLNAWMDYIDEVEGIDTSGASAKNPITFPDQPSR